jgi:hypothetical protein
MSQRPTAMLTTWPFLLSLLLLLLNDLWLKQAFPGLLTGKLSDFAGIALVTLLSMALWPRRRLAAALCVAAGFVYWKSPYSQPLIDAVNGYLPWTFGRVVDYTDLLALLVIPGCAVVAGNIRNFAIPGHAPRRWLRVPVMLATVFAVSATSLMPINRDFEVRQLEADAVLDRGQIARALGHAAAQMDMGCVDCAEPRIKGSYSGKGLGFSYSFPDAKTVSVRIFGAAGGRNFFGGGSPERLERLVLTLKNYLSPTHDELEYVEKIGRRPRHPAPQ